MGLLVFRVGVVWLLLVLDLYFRSGSVGMLLSPGLVFRSFRVGVDGLEGFRGLFLELSTHSSSRKNHRSLSE